VAAAFWSDGLFVVSLHYAQIRAIRDALGARREWIVDPFVGVMTYKAHHAQGYDRASMDRQRGWPFLR
jgi:hypothetical protein